MPSFSSQLMKFASQGKFESAEHINECLLFSYGDNTDEDYINTIIEIKLKASSRLQTAVQRQLKVRLLTTIRYCKELLKSIPNNALIPASLKVRLLATINDCEELLARHSDFNTTAQVRRLPNSDFNATTQVRRLPNSGFNATAQVRRFPNSGFNATAQVRRLPNSGFNTTTQTSSLSVKPVVSFETKEVPEKQSSTTACCNVCYEDINIRNFVKFGCSHEFCITCSRKLTAMEPKKCVCPLCRKKIERVHITMYEYV